MTLSNITTLSSFTDKAPASPEYFNAKFAEVDANFQRIAAVGQSLSDVTLSALSSSLSMPGRWHVDAFGDFQSAISHAYTAGGGTVTASGGTYAVLALRPLPGVILDLNGATLIKNGGGASTHVLDCSGSTTAGPSSLLSSVLASNTTQVPILASGFAVGDVVLLSDLSYAFTSGASSLGQNLELNVIVEASGATVGLRAPTLQSYLTTASASMTVISRSTGIVVRNGTIRLDSGTSGGAIWGHLLYNPVFENVSVQGAFDDAAFLFERTAGVIVRGCRVNEGFNPTTASGLGNGIEFEESSHHGLVTGCLIRDADIGITAGSRSRYITMSDNHVLGGQTAYDVHGQGCAFITITDNTAHGPVEAGVAVGQSSARSGDRNILVANNHLAYCGSNGISVAGSALSEPLGVTIEGNRIWQASQVIANRSGIAVSRAQQVVLRGNDIWEMPTQGSAGITISAATDVLVQGNSIRSLPNQFGINLTDGTGTNGSVRCIGNDFRDVSGANFRFFGVNTDCWVLRNTADDATNTFVSGVTVEGNQFGGRWDSSMATDGLAVSPAYTFQSEVSLGWYRSGVSTMAPSYGTLNLASNSVRLSIRTVAMASLTSANVAVNELVFAIGASGSSLALRSGGTMWYPNSSLSTVG